MCIHACACIRMLCLQKGRGDVICAFAYLLQPMMNHVLRFSQTPQCYRSHTWKQCSWSLVRTQQDYGIFLTRIKWSTCCQLFDANICGKVKMTLMKARRKWRWTTWKKEKKVDESLLSLGISTWLSSSILLSSSCAIDRMYMIGEGGYTGEKNRYNACVSMQQISLDLLELP